jgi:hypothetical protein
MARDYTKYSVVGLGENLNKRQLVYSVVKDFIEKNNPTLETLLLTFPDALQGSKGVVRKESDVDDPKRFNMKAPLKIKNGMHIVVSNQWGDNLPGFIQHVENLGYSIVKSLASDSFDEDDETEEENEDELVLPNHLKLANYNSDWGRYIIFYYENSVDCDEENFKIKLDSVSNCVLPLNPYQDDLTKKWFNSWEALLSSDNKQSYSSSIPISFTNAENDFMSSDVEWGIIWHDQFEDLADGKFPEGVSADTINKLFSNEWFSQLFSFVEQNGF